MGMRGPGIELVGCEFTRKRRTLPVADPCALARRGNLGTHVRADTHR